MGARPMKRTVLAGLATLGLLSGCDAAQQATTCRAASGGNTFAVKYTLVGTPTGCAGDFVPRAGEQLALASYDPPGAERPTVAIAAGDSPLPVYSAEGGTPLLAVGDFTERTADASTSACTAPTLSPLVAGDTTYQFSALQLYVSAANQGTQLKSRLTLTTGTCSATYEALGVYPATDCKAYAADDADHEAPLTDAQGALLLDPSQCEPGHNGINPDVAAQTECEPHLGLCVLRGNDFVKTGGDA
ncbi:hypothetical protein FGE12_12605 [Aggregicoccus sp. 17bor-14]|uniref:hypothetical protein n=1 Tax=Myxococcaceae TaxID=31 RepID=UPI00129CFD8E|nr:MULTISPECIES: hypothetical protein [Myxococcaceae]MBF5043232.1 hypothetical protein [Simulacricoccus sp. 17bor-14]MRI88989.1 hypothetical protein [Aggregicoccus sp. 17bor-14]